MRTPYAEALLELRRAERDVNQEGGAERLKAAQVEFAKQQKARRDANQARKKADEEARAAAALAEKESEADADPA